MSFILSALAMILTLNAGPSPCSLPRADEGPSQTSQETSRGSADPIDAIMIEGHAYPVVRIGGQTWLGENLNSTRDRIGDSLAWVSPGGSNTEGRGPGRLYPWEAACRAAPAGWRLPTVKDWQALLLFIDRNPKAGRKLLASGPGEFGALPVGGVDVLGRGLGQGEQAIFWTSAEACVDQAFCLMIGRDGEAQLVPRPKASCFAVRLIRNDSPQLAALAPSPGGRSN